MQCRRRDHFTDRVLGAVGVAERAHRVVGKACKGGKGQPVRKGHISDFQHIPKATNRQKAKQSNSEKPSP